MWRCCLKLTFVLGFTMKLSHCGQNDKLCFFYIKATGNLGSAVEVVFIRSPLTLILLI